MFDITLLDNLRTRSSVDCDSFDVSTVETLGRFQDSTSNQAIAYFELREHKHKTLVQDALALSRKLSSGGNASQAVDLAMTMLALRMLRHLKGTTHIQVNPSYSGSTADIIQNARAIIKYASMIDPSVDVSRICVKIPSTWQGLEACSALEAEGIKTLATIVFCPEQVALAGQANCSYIAPYINELRVHFDTGFTDTEPGFQLVPWAQAYFESHGCKTKVMPASLTSVQEVMALAGADHITVPPHLLLKLHETTAGESIVLEYPSVFDKVVDTMEISAADLASEAAFKLALARGQGERKLREAIQIFCDFQQKLEKMFEEISEDLT